MRSGIEQIEKNRLTVSPFHPSSVIFKGIYALHLNAYQQTFDRSYIGIQLFDDLVTSPRSSMNFIMNFLEVDPNIELNTAHKNARIKPKQMPEDARVMLTDFYSESIVRLGEMLDRDPAHWLSA